MSFNHSQATSGVHIPQPHCSIERSGNELLLVMSPRQRVNHIRVAGKRSQALARLHVPELDWVALGSGQEFCAVRRESADVDLFRSDV
jgi:hypothetical protein